MEYCEVPVRWRSVNRFCVLTRFLVESWVVPNANEEILEFACPKCAKRLKATSQIAGRRVKCPKCGQSVRVPGASPPATQATGDEWLSLETPAIQDITDRERIAAEVKAKRAALVAQHKAREKQLTENQPVTPVVTVVPHSRRETAEAKFANSAEAIDDEFTLQPVHQNQSDSKSNAKPTPQPSRKTSVFDDDLPELSELTQAAPKPLPLGNIDDLRDLDTLIPDLNSAFSANNGENPSANPKSPNKSSAPQHAAPSSKSRGVGSLLDLPDTTDHEYRIACKVCGTAQYVRLSAKGMKIKCPDCLTDFKVPPPPPGWAPKTKVKLELTHEDVPLAAAETFQEQKTLEAHRTRASAMLEKAQREISDDELDRLYDGDFDTAGFMQRAFGFMRDPIALSFVAGYGFVFACVFALAQYGLNNADSGYGRGALLLGVIGAPMIGILFGLPMLSAALALLESVANRQPKVVDWPGFNMFDNFGDMLAIAAALVGAMLPGYMIGTFIGGDQQGAGRMQIMGLMLSVYLLFPILLLSILDNGSLFQPISTSVMSSFQPAAEAWGGYYLKTMIAFSITMLLWFLLLGTGKSPWLAGAAGFLVPWLVFFTFQQLGALADSISEHLSIVFTPPGDKDAEEGSHDNPDVSKARDQY